MSYGQHDQLGPPEQRTWAMIAHLSGLVAAWIALGFLGPLIVLLVQGDKSPFVRRQAVEALNFQLTLLIATVVAGFLALVTFGIALLVVVPLGAVVAVAALVFIIIGAVQANNGQDYRYPINWRLVK